MNGCVEVSSVTSRWCRWDLLKVPSLTPRMREQVVSRHDETLVLLNPHGKLKDFLLVSDEI